MAIRKKQQYYSGSHIDRYAIDSPNLHWKTTHKHKGVTLVECLITISIAAIISLGGIGSLSILWARHTAHATGRTITTALSWARTTAVTSGTPVILCPSEDGQHCSRSGDILIALKGEHCLQQWSLRQSIYYVGFPQYQFPTYQPSGLSDTNGHFATGNTTVYIAQGGRVTLR